MSLFDFGTDTNQFSTQFGNTLQYIPNSDPVTKQEEEDKDSGEDSPTTPDKKQADVAGIITASALGLNSITNAISAFTGGGSNQQTDTSTYQPREEEPKKKAPNPMLVIGIIVAVMVLIGLLAFARKAAKPPVAPTA